MSRCRSCQAEIVWGRTAGGGKIPLDAEAVEMKLPAGLFRYDPESEAARPVPIIRLYRTHFATCPDADTHRRKV